MDKRYISRILNFILLIWLIFSPIFWRFDLSKSTAGYYDAFLMAPGGIFHITVFYAFLLLSLFMSDITFYHLLLLSFYFPIIQLVNYPLLTFRDVYLHAAPVKAILINGKIEYPKDPAPESWPGSFNLHAIFKIVLGCDLIASNFLLYYVLVFIFALFLYLLTEVLGKKGYKLAKFSAILFIGLFFTHLLDNFHHYSRTALAFTFLLFFFYVFISINGRNGQILNVFIIMAIIITHPFQSVALIGFLLFHSILTAQEKSARFTLFALLIFTSWFLYHCGTAFEATVKRIKIFLSPKYIAPLVETMSIRESLPLYGVILRLFFRYAFILLLSLALFSTLWVIYNVFIRKQTDTLCISLSALLPMAAVMLTGLLLLPDWTVWRFTGFGAFPAAFTSITLLHRLITCCNPKFNVKFKLSNNKRLLHALLLLFIITLNSVTMMLRFERNYYFGQILHQSELSSLSFLFTRSKYSTVSFISWRTCVYSAYFNYNGTHKTLRLWDAELKSIGKNQTELLLTFSTFFKQSNFTIRGMRDEVDLYRLDSPKETLIYLDDAILLPKSNLIYSNGYYVIYNRVFSLH